MGPSPLQVYTHFFICVMYTVKLELSRAHTPRALHNYCCCSAIGLEPCEVPRTYFCDLTTFPYNELKHAQSKQHIAYLGVVNRRGQAKARSVVFVTLVKCFKAKICQFLLFLTS